MSKRRYGASLNFATEPQVGGIDHQPIRLAALCCQTREDLVEHAHAAPADEPVVDRLVRAILGRGVTPTQTIPDHEDDTADDPAVINSGNPVRQRKIRL